MSAAQKADQILDCIKEIKTDPEGYSGVLQSATDCLEAAKARVGIVREVGKLLNISTERKPRKRKPKAQVPSQPVQEADSGLPGPTPSDA